MARIQILELPVTGQGDSVQTPFALVIDQADDSIRAAFDSNANVETRSLPDGTMYSLQRSLAEQLGARAVLVFDGAIEIPANGADLPEALLVGDGDPAADDSSPLDEARMWARHGYEIGQRHCGWSDHGVAPAWLTEGWPRSFDSCDHLRQASEFDTLLTKVRGLSEAPEGMDANHPYSDDYLLGYRMAMSTAKSVASNTPAEHPGDTSQPPTVPLQPAYAAVRTYIGTLAPGDPARTAAIWKAVRTALDAHAVGLRNALGLDNDESIDVLAAATAIRRERDLAREVMRTGRLRCAGCNSIQALAAPPEPETQPETGGADQ